MLPPARHAAGARIGGKGPARGRIVDQALVTASRRLVEERSTFLHVTHVNPDADGFGSALAMHRWLLSQGKDSRVLLPSPLPRKIEFLARPGEVRVVSADEPLPEDAVFIVYDVSSLGRLGALEAAVRRSKPPVVVFDHHDGDIDFDALAFVDVTAGATGQVIFELLEAWGADITEDLALPLYVAIVADTGSFNYGKTSPRTHEIAGHLIAAGVKPLQVHGLLEGTKTLEAMHAGGEVLRTVTIDPEDARAAHAIMTVAQYSSGGADALEMLDLVNHTIALRGVLAGVLFVEAAPAVTRLSLRSKGDTSIVEVARAFGGGGHRNAAGATIHRPLREIQEQVLARIRQALVDQHGAA